MNFGALIEQEQNRTRKNGAAPWTKKSLAERAGIHRVYLHQLIRGERQASPWVTERIAKALGVKLHVVANALAKSRRSMLSDDRMEG